MYVLLALGTVVFIWLIVYKNIAVRHSIRARNLFLQEFQGMAGHDNASSQILTAVGKKCTLPMKATLHQ